MFRLRRLSEDDTIFLLQCISSECISRSLLAQGPVFIDFPSIFAIIYLTRQLERWLHPIRSGKIKKIQLQK